jgi:two-component system CheB/CheR fusion protein
MSRLLDDLLEVSRVTQDKIELRKRPVDLRPIVKEAAEAVRELMQTRGVTLEMELDPEPLVVDGDPARLQQVHVNLLNNAAKYTPRDGHVWLSASRDGDQVVVRVEDDGVGIPKPILDDVFELFVQSNRTLDRADGGLGVGLTLVRGLVERHGGSVSAHSEGDGHGSEFVVRLPLSQQALPTQPVLEEKRMYDPEQKHSLHVVIVEDNDDSRMMMCELLELSGFQCHTAASGSLGLEVINELCPDVALIDIGLPEIDGLELARMLRKNPRHRALHLIALTGYGQREDREAARQAGFDAHLVKPVDFEALLELLRVHAAQNAARRERERETEQGPPEKTQLTG